VDPCEADGRQRRVISTRPDVVGDGALSGSDVSPCSAAVEMNFWMGGKLSRGACRSSGRSASKISTFGAGRRKSRNSVTCTRILSSASWSMIREIGRGVATRFISSAERCSSGSILWT